MAEPRHQTSDNVNLSPYKNLHQRLLVPVHDATKAIIMVGRQTLDHIKNSQLFIYIFTRSDPRSDHGLYDIKNKKQICSSIEIQPQTFTPLTSPST